MGTGRLNPAADVVSIMNVPCGSSVVCAGYWFVCGPTIECCNVGSAANRLLAVVYALARAMVRESMGKPGSASAMMIALCSLLTKDFCLFTH